MLVKLPREVGKVLTRMQDNGFEAYVAGECVRDSILGRKPFGWDVVTNANLDQLKAALPEAEVFSSKYGVVRLEFIHEVTDKETGESLETGFIVDVASYRKNAQYKNGKLTGAEATQNIEDDLACREFTIDAIAENNTKLCDP